jgi:hypothetical protein
MTVRQRLEHHDLTVWDGKGYHNVHAYTTGTGENGCTTKVCIIDRKQHVEEREEDCQQLPVVVFWLPPPAVM